MTSTTPIERFDISKEALLVRLAISQWTGYKTDAKLAQDAATANKANAAAIKAGVKLLEDTDRKPIAQIVNEARTFFYEHTCLFEDGGWRLVPAKKYKELKDKMEELQNKFIDAVDKLVQNHAELERKFEANLGDIRHRYQFPSAEGLRALFKWRLEENAIVNPEHIVLKGLEGAAVRQVQASAERKLKEQLATTQTEIVERLVKAIGAVSEKCGKEHGDEGATFRDSLIGNVRELCEILPSLNIGGDKRIERAIKRVATNIAPVDPKILREDKEVRKRVADAASDVLDDLKGFKPVKI